MKSLHIILSDKDHADLKRVAKKYNKRLFEAVPILIRIGVKMSQEKGRKEKNDS